MAFRLCQVRALCPRRHCSRNTARRQVPDKKRQGGRRLQAPRPTGFAIDLELRGELTEDEATEGVVHLRKGVAIPRSARQV
jgi:hypothetical protein